MTYFGVVLWRRNRREPLVRAFYELSQLLYVIGLLGDLGRQVYDGRNLAYLLAWLRNFTKNK